MEAPATASEDGQAMDWNVWDELTGRPLWDVGEGSYSASEAGTTERPWQSPRSGSVFGQKAVWLCRSCDSPHWKALTPSSWECEKCGSHEFYDATVPTTFSSTWAPGHTSLRARMTSLGQVSPHRRVEALMLDAPRRRPFRALRRAVDGTSCSLTIQGKNGMENAKQSPKQPQRM